jgi:hypothetical protein
LQVALCKTEKKAIEGGTYKMANLKGMLLDVFAQLGT